MAVTNQQIIDYLLANPNLSDAQIAATMQEFSVTPAQLAQAVNLPTEVVQERYVAAAPNTNTTENINKLASQILSQGTTEAWTGGLPPEKAALYMASDLAKSGVTNIEQIAKGDSGIVNTMTGEKLVSGYGERTGGNLWSGSYEGKGNTGFGVNFDEQGKPVFYSQGASSSTLKNDVLKLAAVAGAVYGLGGFDGLLSGVASGAGTAVGAGEAATAFELANAGIAGGTAAFTPAQLALIEAGASAAEVAAAGGGLLTSAAIAPTAVTPTALAPAAVTPVAGAVTPAATGGGLLSSVLPASVADAVTKVGTGVATGLLTKGLADTVSGVAQTAGSLIQSQESKEAAQQAAQDITKATQTGVEASQFRPVGMTTRFGTSNYTYDPVTGRMTSAGYQLSPEAKNAQDRLVALAGRGLTQAEQAQAQFAPLQTAAQNLYSLGSQYIAKSPEEAAQDYINKQMQLIAPSREMDLANLQNRLFQQGRTGVSVAQGGSLGATTPELQALYNARAQQELQLAANAQREGRENTLFGSNLYDLGTAKLSNYYGGQTQAYAPYTTALGQVQALETAAQQPLMMGASLGQQSATAGANAGRIGLTGQQLSSAYNTNANATFNPFAGLLTAAGNPNAMFGQAFSSLFSPTVPPVTAMSAPATSYGAGNYYGNQDVLGVWGT